jgi:4-hydroxybenzoate polyprenyltransferase/phosphoserine phosphatase
MVLVDVPSPASEPAAPLPLYVDLDGSVIATDLLWESLLALARQRPLELLKVPLWLCQGRALLKRRLAEAARLDPASLPYRPEVLEFLRGLHNSGRRLILATAAEERAARSVADHLGIFDEVMASDGQTNLKGREKLRRIIDEVGTGRFDYLGDSSADLPLWEKAGAAVLVGPSGGLLKRACAVCKPSKIFEVRRQRGRAMLRAMRPHQWAKNVLLAVPLMASHQLHNLNALLHVICAIVVFSLAASSVYIFNDLLDLESDRKHPRKRLRPLASGDLPLTLGLAIAPMLALVSVGTAAVALGKPFALLLLLYLGMTTAYSLYLKRKLMVDVLCLAGLYTARIFAGGAAAGVVVSHWLLAFSMFFFLSLAFCKRYAELSRAELSEKRVGGRGYFSVDLDLIRILGPVSGYLSVLVLCLYINSPDVLRLYAQPAALWLICPLLLYWITRVWFLAQRRLMEEDPVVFALKDRISYVTGLVAAAIVIVGSIHFPG